MTKREEIVLRKAEAVIDVISRFEEENLNPSFQEFLDAVLNKWSEFNYSQKNVDKVSLFQRHDLINSNQHRTEVQMCID